MNQFKKVTRALLCLGGLGGALFADSGVNHRISNLHFGVSGGNAGDITRRFCCSGTLGSLVQANGTQYILSNNHVLGLSGQAQPGQDISQPGLIDNNCRVARVVADFAAASPLGSNVDAALAQLRAGAMDSTGFIEDIGTISSVVRPPEIGLQVAKSGRTTGFTTGAIASINTSVNVRYPKSCGQNGGAIVNYTNQVVINSTTFSAGGDSGSLIVSNDAAHNPVALLFAGSSTSTIGNPIGEVLSKLGTALGGATVSFVGAAIAPVTLASGPAQILINQAATALHEHRPQIMGRNPNVIGMGVGVADDNPSEAVIVVYIDRTAGAIPALPDRVRNVRIKRVLTDPIVAYGCCTNCKN